MVETTSMNRSMRILVVDDLESMRKLVIRNLQQMGYQSISQAANGKEALSMLTTNQNYQVVLTDWNMPVMSGIDLLREIRANPKLCRLPVLMITAEIERHQVTEAAETGVSDFLVKPFTVGGLQEKFDKILANLAKGKVLGAPGQDKVQPAESGMNSALFASAHRVQPAAKRFASAPAPLKPTLVSRPLDKQPYAGNEPLALIITEDLQIKLSRQATLLVIDDVPDNIDILVGLLQDEYKVRAARSGESALKMLAASMKAKQPLPDLILLDVMMPEMDGFEVCRRLKADPELAAVPVIFLTAADDARNVVEGLELGAVDYVTKPANPTVLKTRVRTHLTRIHAFEALRQQNAVLEENARLQEEVDHITRHDLKNPIGGIMNFADMLLADEKLNADQVEMISTIGDSARVLLNMVNLSLDMAKIERGTYQLQAAPVDLLALLKRSLQDRSAELNAKQIQLKLVLRSGASGEQEHPKFMALGDEILCYSVFGNLVKNAAEAAPQGSALTVTFSADRPNWASVEITNAGAVPKSIRGEFFEKFATAGKRGGTGIGTYSARMLTEVQGGEIAMATSDEKNETTLTVSLPQLEA